MLDPKAVPFRTLRFASLDDALREAQRLADAAQRGECRHTGNWPPGTVLAHLAWWIEAIDRNQLPTPRWFIRLLGPLLKKQMLNQPLPRGFRIPGAASGTLGADPSEVAPALDRLRRAYERLATQPLPSRHPVFGRLTREEWIALHIRHAELHLGYLTT